MSDPNESLTPRQHAAVSALLGAKTIGAAAKKARVGEATLRRWMTSDSTFQRAYRSARRAVMDGLVTRLQQATSQAVDSLERNLKCGRPGDEIRAALGILDFATRGLEVGDLMERVEELERLATGETDDATPKTTKQAGRATSDEGS